jgi:hypothetical protein
VQEYRPKWRKSRLFSVDLAAVIRDNQAADTKVRRQGDSAMTDRFIYRRSMHVGGLALLVAGCVTPSAQIATAMTGYGFAPAQSQCVGERITANLSLSQLQQLGRAARAARQGDTSPGRLTVGDFLRVAGEVKDPEVALEVGKAAAGCGVLADAVRGTPPL